MDLLVQADNTIHAIATDPITLFTVSPNHRNYSIMDLYEYFPLMGPGTGGACSSVSHTAPARAYVCTARPRYTECATRHSAASPAVGCAGRDRDLGVHAQPARYLVACDQHGRTNGVRGLRKEDMEGQGVGGSEGGSKYGRHGVRCWLSTSLRLSTHGRMLARPGACTDSAVHQLQAVGDADRPVQIRRCRSVRARRRSRSPPRGRSPVRVSAAGPGRRWGGLRSAVPREHGPGGGSGLSAVAAVHRQAPDQRCPVLRHAGRRKRAADAHPR